MLLGRDHEQLALVRLLQNARAGNSGVLAIVGEAGIGKSALLAYAGEQADGMQALRARGVESEAHIPFAGLFELLRPALPLIDQIPDPQAAALESALALRPAAAPGRFAVGAATLSLLASYSDAAPVAVLVDDAHWLDGSSADALLFAFRRLVADPIAVILTAREGESSLLDGADLATLRLQGLDCASAVELLRRQRDEPLSQSLAERLHHETGGNRGWTVYEIGPATQGIGALMMLNIMEQFPMKEWGYKTTKSMRAMIEAKKLAYVDIVKYVRRPQFFQDSGAGVVEQTPRGGAREAHRPHQGGVRRGSGRSRRIHERRR